MNWKNKNIFFFLNGIVLLYKKIYHIHNQNMDSQKQKAFNEIL